MGYNIESVYTYINWLYELSEDQNIQYAIRPSRYTTGIIKNIKYKIKLANINDENDIFNCDDESGLLKPCNNSTNNTQSNDNNNNNDNNDNDTEMDDKSND